MKKIILLFIFLSTFNFINAQITGISENFEDTSAPVSGTWALPSGDWKVFDNGVGTLQSWSALSNLNFTFNFPGRSANVTREFVPAGATSEDWLVMPIRKIRANEQLRFFTRQGFQGNDGSVYQIRVSTNADPTLQSAYTLLKSYTEDELVGPPPAIFSQYDEKIIDLTTTPTYFNQNVFIAFVKVYARPADVSIPSAGDRWLIDNVQLAQKCFAPTDLFATTTTTTAKLQWLPTVGNYEVQWGAFPLDTSAPANIYQVSSGNPTGSNILTGLTPNTKYQFRVRKICGPGITSEWSFLFPFNTLNIGATCAEPIIFTTLPYSSSDNTLSFGDNLTQVSPGATGCGTTAGYLGGTDVVYKYTVPLTGGPSQISIAMNPLGAVNTSVFVYGSCAAIGVNCLAGVANTTSAIRTISPFNVTPGATYYIVISELVIPFSFNYILTVQAITCPSPTALSANNITQNSADLGWTSPLTTTSWQYEVQKVSNIANNNIPSGSGVTVNLSSVTVGSYSPLNGTFAPMVQGTNYQYWVRSKCGSTDTYSPWAGPFLFQTAQCPVVKQCSYTFTMTDTGAIGSGWEGARMEIRQNGLVLATIGELATTASTIFTTKLCDNLPIELYWLNGGIHAAEVGITIKNSFGQILFILPPGSEAKVGTIVYPEPTIPVTIKYAECDFPECQAPNGLISTPSVDITVNSAKVKWIVPSWLLAGYTYNVYVATAPFVTPNTPPVAVAPNSFYYPNAAITISGTAPNLIATFQIPAVLAQDTNYKFWVQINCSPNNGPSSWSLPGSFITKIACPKATILNVEITGTPPLTVLPTQAKVFWTTPATPPVTSWWVKAVPVFPPAPVVTPVFDPLTWTQVLSNPNILANAFTLGNGVLGSPNEPLQPDTDYNYYVVSDCNATGSGVSNVAGPKLFHTRPTCFRPTNPNVTAASITTTSATFTWTRGEATDVAWEILCVPKPDTTLQTEVPPINPSYPQQLLFTVPVSNVTIVGNNVTYQLPVGSLVTAKIYNYFIRTVCSATDKSKWTLVKLFNTLPCNTVDKCNYKIVLTNLALPLPLDNDWFGARIQIRQNGIVVATVGASGINSGIPIDVPMCPGVPFDLFWSVPGTIPQEISFTLYNPFSEQIFQYNATSQASPFVPYILYASTGSCTPIGCVVPLALPVVATNVFPFTATVKWTPNGSETQWEIVAMPLANDAQPIEASPVQGTPTGVNVGGKIYYLATYTGTPPATFTLTGLTPDTDYVYYIRSVCGPTNSTSVWNLVPIPFKTKIACYQPATITLVPNSQTSNSVSLWWTNNPLNTATAWDIIAVPTGTIPAGTSTPTGTWSGIIPNASTPYTLNGLTANTKYDIYVRTNCIGLNVGTDNYGTSKWTGLGTVTTDPNCYPPVNLSWINDNLNPAEITWSPNPNQVGNSQWTVYTQLYTGAVNVPATGGLAVTSTVTPTPIQYNIKDSFGNISNNATIGVGTVDILPVATNDIANYASPVTINVITNDNTADAVLPATVSLIIPNGVLVTGLVVNALNGNVTSMTIPNQGTWSVNPTTGAITFTKLATSTGVPTPVQYNVEDQEGNQSNNATITLLTPTPTTTSDVIFYTTGTIIIPVLLNDTTGGTAVPSTVSLVPPATGVTGVVTDTNLDVTAMTVTGEGTWSVNITTGVITFTPVAGFSGFPTPIQYNVEDILAVQSNNATVTLSNIDILPIALSDTQPLVAGVNTITVLTNDNTGDIVVPARVSLIAPIGATGTVSDTLLDVISFNVPLQGKWAVNITTGVITFTPLAGFTGVPTPIQYTVRDAQSNISNPATITLTSLLPIATNDNLPFTNNSIASVNVTTNDTTGGVVVPATVSLILPLSGAIEVVTNTTVTPNRITSFRVPNEGRWTLNPTTGVVTFTPIISYTTPIGNGALVPGFYEFYVASNCGPNGTSILAGPQYFSIYAEPVICAAINLNLGTNINSVNVCDDDNCTNLTANYNDIFDTSSYSMVPVKYTNIPYAYTAGPGSTNLNIAQDDLWSAATPLPFKFCFFGTNSQQVWVGSNGVITFTEPTGTFCPWQFNQQQIPNAGFPVKNAIYAPYQDSDPRPDPISATDRTINFGVVGSAPCRAFVINYYNIGQFQCNQNVGFQTSQVVLYETSNIVEIYVKDRTPCSWQQGQGVLGIQNAAGDLAFVPPGKNTGAWTIKEEAYRFTPAGASVVEFSWKDANNAIISTGPTINVCPTVSTVYNASATYTSCGENPVTVTKPVTVTVNSVKVVDIEDVTACGSYTLPTLPVGNYFTEINGGGTQKNAGDVISADTTLYIYATTASGITPVCTDEDVFTITIKNPSTPISTGNINVCALNPIQTITADAFVNGGETIVWYDTLNNVVASPTWNQLGTTTYFAESAFKSNDYISLTAPTTVTIPAGAISATVTVATTSDLVDEGMENFFIKGTVTSTNTKNTNASGKANLSDNASQVVVSVSNVTVVEGSPAIFRISLSNPSTLPTTINVATAPADVLSTSALSPSDYTALPTTLVTIPPGSLSIDVSVPTIADTSAELEKFKLRATVTSTNTLNTTAFGTATIAEASSLPTLMISNESVVEGATATFTFTLSKVSTTPTIIDVKSVDGTAINIDCRGAVKTPVTLTLYDLPLPISGGDQKECATFPTVQTLTATATPATADLVVTWYDVASGGTLLTTAPTLNTVGIKTYYAESVVLNTDYTVTTGTLTIPAGQTSAIVSVPVLTDTTVEPNETFYLNAAVTSTNTLNTNVVGTGLISGVSAKPVVYISKPTVIEGTNAIFDISLSKPSLLPTKINFVTSDGTAISGTDYLQLTQQVIIPAGSVTGSISVITSVDAIVDSGENFTLTGTVVSTNTANTSIVTMATITEIADLPTIIISNPIATEGNNAQFTITLSAPSTLPTVIIYTTNPFTAGSGCVSPTRTPVKLEILEIPAIPAGTDKIECALTPLQTLTATASTITAGATVVWYDSETSTTIVSPTWNSIGTKIYWAESVNSTTLCKSSSRKSVSLTLKALPLAPTTGASQSVCSVTPLQTLTAVATAPAGASLVWYDIASGGTALTTPPTWNTVGSKLYYVESQEGVAPNICVSATRTEVKLEIRQSPAIPTTPAKQSVCATNPIQTLTALASTSTSGAIIKWYTLPSGGSEVNPILNNLGTATYYAESQNSATNCFSESRTKVELEILDLPKFSLFGNCIVKDYIIKVVPEANFDIATATYVWKNPAGQVVSTASSYKATAVGSYTCEVTNTNTCATTVSYNVISVSCSIQKGISPKGVNGGDGLNDYFDLEGLNVTKLQVFNRYGTAVYSKENYIKEWFGQSDAGNELSDGTYYYVIERNNEDPLTGWIYINREQ